MKQKNQNRQSSQNTIIVLAILSALTIISFAIFLFSNSQSPEVYYLACDSQPPLNYSCDNEPSYTQPEESNHAFSLYPVNISDISDTGYLSLVNHENIIDSGLFDTQMMVSAWPGIQVSTTALRVHPTARKAVVEMFDAAREVGISGLYVTSGYRDIDTQENLFVNGNPNYVMPPGHSEHHTGLALDILKLGYGMAEFGSTVAGHWMADNSWRFGFVLRYPAGTQHITGIAFEPWHFRYVGRVHAWYMYTNEIVLEEYIDLLHQSGGFSVYFEGRKYSILHQRSQNGIIYLPEDKSYIISSDNTGGFIITVWS